MAGGRFSEDQPRDFDVVGADRPELRPTTEGGVVRYGVEPGFERAIGVELPDVLERFEKSL